MQPSILDQDFLPFQYEGMKLQEACFINANPYFTRRAIGEFLGYKYPQEAIDKIIQKNPHISDSRWTSQVKMTCQVGESTQSKTGHTQIIDIEVYDPIGLQLIIFESKQPKAIQYKIAVAHLVYAFMKGEIKPSTWAMDRIAAIKQILSCPPTYKRSALIKDLAVRESKCVQTVYRWLDKFGGIKTGKGNKKGHSLRLKAA